ncbi:hypothetical protein CBR_g833 [Chara braunii]|uniref:methionine--tRNA ligase n=1 Tax=Chara braunii TaxID=69332 RepID=A0A388KCC1_CHABU|nr:hypothetical protein CBR_g833 [Chara braunii]|eukprot:GBG67705.1 hypothetical protein CBR_g833 [Chara braunii]
MRRLSQRGARGHQVSVGGKGGGGLASTCWVGGKTTRHVAAAETASSARSLGDMASAATVGSPFLSPSLSSILRRNSGPHLIGRGKTHIERSISTLNGLRIGRSQNPITTAEAAGHEGQAGEGGEGEGDGETYMITTPLYYVNAPPHMGSAYPTIAADALARFQLEELDPAEAIACDHQRLRGKKVIFVTGTDEHGEKIAVSAASNNREPKEHVDLIAEDYRSLWKELDISYDRFVRTTDLRHRKIVEEFFQRVWNKGDIYRADYEGLYCVNCEEYKDEKELLEDNCCAIHRKPCLFRREDNYFFQLSNYQDALEKLYEENTNFVRPSFRKNEVLTWVKEGVKDFSISRAVDWGIPVPVDPKQTIYVWFDALLGYVSSLLEGSDDTTLEAALQRGWPAQVHIIGKDILRFHAVYWPAMLLSAGLPLPKAVFGHGFLTKDGLKMGKSLGNTIEPLYLVGKYGADAVRYYFLKEIEFGKDGDFSEKRFVEIVNANLANNIDNKPGVWYINSAQYRGWIFNDNLETPRWVWVLNSSPTVKPNIYPPYDSRWRQAGAKRMEDKEVGFITKPMIDEDTVLDDKQRLQTMAELHKLGQEAKLAFLENRRAREEAEKVAGEEKGREGGEGEGSSNSPDNGKSTKEQSNEKEGTKGGKEDGGPQASMKRKLRDREAATSTSSGQEAKRSNTGGWEEEDPASQEKQQGTVMEDATSEKGKSQNEQMDMSSSATAESAAAPAAASASSTPRRREDTSSGSSNSAHSRHKDGGGEPMEVSAGGSQEGGISGSEEDMQQDTEEESEEDVEGEEWEDAEGEEQPETLAQWIRTVHKLRWERHIECEVRLAHHKHLRNLKQATTAGEDITSTNRFEWLKKEQEIIDVEKKMPNGGNLLSRTLGLLRKNCGGKIPVDSGAVSEGHIVREQAAKSVAATARDYEELSFGATGEAILGLATACNHYLDGQAPWLQFKKGTNEAEQAGMDLVIVLEASRILAVLLQPMVPALSQRIFLQLGFSDTDWTQLSWADTAWGVMKEGHSVCAEPFPIFSRLDDPEQLGKVTATEKPPSSKKKRKAGQGTPKDQSVVSVAGGQS